MVSLKCSQIEARSHSVWRGRDSYNEEGAASTP